MSGKIGRGFGRLGWTAVVWAAFQAAGSSSILAAGPWDNSGGGWWSNGGSNSSTTPTTPLPSNPGNIGGVPGSNPGGGAGTSNAGGSDGVEFQMIPLDYGSDCNSVLLRATRKYPGTAFVLPRALVAVNQDRQNLFEIIPGTHGQYIMRFGLYFPKQDEEMQLRRADHSVTSLKACDISTMIAEANRHAAANEKVEWASALQITGIAVRIDGTSQPYQVGASETALLNYQGVNHIAEFVIPDRDSLESILRRVTGDLGLEINLDFRFSARNSDGRVEASVDSKTLQKGLQAYLVGRVTVAAGELQTMIGKVLSDNRGAIYMEQSSGSPDFNTLASRFIDQLVRSDPSSCYGCGYGGGGYYGGYGGGGGWPNTGGFPGDPSQGGGWPNQGGQQGQGYGPMIQVGALFRYLNSTQKASLSAVNLGRNETHAYSTSVIFKAALSDPGQSTLQLASGNRAGTTQQQYLKAGTVLHLYPYERSVQRSSVREVTRYFTQDGIRLNRLSRFFPSVPADLGKLTLLTPPEGLRSALYVGDPVVVSPARDTGFWVRKHEDAKTEPPVQYLVWGESAQQLVPELPQDEELILTTLNLDRIPVQFSLSELGPKKFPLKELLASDEYWEGHYDARFARIDLTVKKDLGYLTLWNTETLSNQLALNRQFFEEKWDRTKNAMISRTEPTEARETVTVPAERSVLKFRLRVESKDGSGVAGPIQLLPLPQPSGTAAQTPALIP